MSLPINEYGQTGTPVNPYHIEQDTTPFVVVMAITLAVIYLIVRKS